MPRASSSPLISGGRFTAFNGRPTERGLSEHIRSDRRIVSPRDWRREGDWIQRSLAELRSVAMARGYTTWGFATDRSGRQFGQGVLDRGNIEFKISNTLNRTEAGQRGRFCGGEKRRAPRR